MAGITPATMLYVSGVLYGVGTAFGITLATCVLFYSLIGVGRASWTKNLSLKLIYVMAVFDIIYYHVKIAQLNGINNDCGTQEALSVFFYLGSNCVLYFFFITRYIEVYGWKPMVLTPVLVLIGVFMVSIPVSIASNVTLIENGVCSVYHPPISALLPSTTCFVISVYLLTLFLYPLLKSQGFNLNENRTRIAKMIFITNAIAIVSTVLFNSTLSTPAGQYAPLTSSLDLMVNYVMACAPYIVSKLSKGYSDGSTTNGGSGGGTQEMSGKKQSMYVDSGAASNGHVKISVKA